MRRPRVGPVAKAGWLRGYAPIGRSNHSYHRPLRGYRNHSVATDNHVTTSGVRSAGRCSFSDPWIVGRGSLQGEGSQGHQRAHSMPSNANPLSTRPTPCYPNREPLQGITKAHPPRTPGGKPGSRTRYAKRLVKPALSMQKVPYLLGKCKDGGRKTAGKPLLATKIGVVQMVN